MPWIIQEAFPGYHGVAWYWRDFTGPTNPHSHGRFLLRFWQVDYEAEVWLNGVSVGKHEGGETPFLLDVTGLIKPGEKNRLTVRVLNPTTQPIDGIVLNETARRCKVMPFRAGAGFNHGGITDSVELICKPAVYVDDLFVTAFPENKAGRMQVQVSVRNTTASARKGQVEITVASARSGETTAVVHLERVFGPESTLVNAELVIDNPHLWQLNDPYLYRVTARATIEGSSSFDEQSTRCGFRDFRFADGYFRLNGQRIYLRCSHTCNHYPIGLQFPRDPDLLRRDLLNMKVMGFNAIRFIWGGATRTQLDLCDEIGLMVYEESYASMWIDPSPRMAERFDLGVSELIRRDRNHPSVVMWGLLNEAPNCPAFHHAVAMLPLVRSLDTSRMVMLNSGRFDKMAVGIESIPGIRTCSPVEPWVAINGTAQTIESLGITWPPGHLALHPGPSNQFSVVRWTSPSDGQADVVARFTGLAHPTTTDVHVMHNGRGLFQGFLNLNGAGNQADFSTKVRVAAGDRIDCAVGPGNGNYGADTTGLTFTVTVAGKTYDATGEFSPGARPQSVWSYGYEPAASLPDASTFTAYPADTLARGIGSLSNPGSTTWEDVLRDHHVYPRVPHTGEIIQSLRQMSGDRQPVFLSEYGIGSAVDLWRAVRHFEQRGAADLEDAQFFRDKLNQFLADWKNWHMEEVFARPEDFFMESLKKMAGQRTLGLNAIRSNPNIIGHSLTGAIDHVMCGEGLTTLFRELKPGTIDALFDAWAPLRWCLFAEPVHIARGASIQLEAVLANEDVLAPGEYPALVQVIGPQLNHVIDRELTIKIPEREGKGEPPFAGPCFSDRITVDGPPGRYRFLVSFRQGAAAAGGETDFYVTDPAQMPTVAGEVVLWGDDPDLAQWLTAHGIRTRPFAAAAPARCEVILVSSKPPAPGDAAVFAELARCITAGSNVVFLSPEVFAKPGQPTAWLPLAKKGTVQPIVWLGLYLKDEWAKNHPIFEGLPAGGLMDYTYYREIIPDLVWSGQDPPDEAVAGAIRASQDYASGLMVAVYKLGAGRFVLNTLRIRENLGVHPAAERLLRNMLRYAARDVEKPLAAPPEDLERQLKAMGY